MEGGRGYGKGCRESEAWEGMGGVGKRYGKAYRYGYGKLRREREGKGVQEGDKGRDVIADGGERGEKGV